MRGGQEAGKPLLLQKCLESRPAFEGEEDHLRFGSNDTQAISVPFPIVNWVGGALHQCHQPTSVPSWQMRAQREAWGGFFFIGRGTEERCKMLESAAGRFNWIPWSVLSNWVPKKPPNEPTPDPEMPVRSRQ